MAILNDIAEVQERVTYSARSGGGLATQECFTGGSVLACFISMLMLSGCTLIAMLNLEQRPRLSGSWRGCVFPIIVIDSANACHEVLALRYEDAIRVRLDSMRDVPPDASAEQLEHMFWIGICSDRVALILDEDGELMHANEHDDWLNSEAEFHGTLRGKQGPKIEGRMAVRLDWSGPALAEGGELRYDDKFETVFVGDVRVGAQRSALEAPCSWYSLYRIAIANVDLVEDGGNIRAARIVVVGDDAARVGETIRRGLTGESLASGSWPYDNEQLRLGIRERDFWALVLAQLNNLDFSVRSYEAAEAKDARIAALLAALDEAGGE